MFIGSKNDIGQLSFGKYLVAAAGDRNINTFVYW